ncbi:MAG TPA: ATP-binding protein, partial [Longimicrobiales bacterium]|nr:ATP-binding protein [Longimicrobiales bacterium]
MLQSSLEGAVAFNGELLAAQAELERRYAQLEALYRMTAAVSRTTSLAKIYELALTCLQDALNADRASVLLFDSDGVMRFKAQRNLSPQYCSAVEGHSPWARDATEPLAFGLADVSVELQGELRETVLREGIGALAFIPLVWSGRLLGKFMVYYDAPHRFTDDELQLAQTIATQIALAITRSQADEAVRAREREYRTLADHLPLVIARFDRTARYLYVNPAIEVATGMERVAFIGTSIEETSMAPEVTSMWRKRIERCFDTREPVDFDFMYPTPAGVRTFNSKIVPEFDEQGEVRSVISIASDVTDRVQAEERQRFLAEVSTRLVESLDYESTLSNLGDLMIETIADSCAIDEVLTDGSTRRICVVSRSENAVVEPSNTMSIELKARGRTLGMIHVASDPQRRKYDEQDREFANELAQRAALVIDNARLYQEAHNASMAKSAFLATMSHELRTPLNAILGYAELMELGVAGSVNSQQTQQLERISASAWHLLSVIEEILTFSRVEAGREEVRPEAVDVKELMNEAAAMVMPAAERKDLHFVIAPPPRDCVIRTDHGKVRQILLNLLSNAVKFTEAGRVECTCLEGNDCVTFAVTDTGPGIPADQIDRVFEPFWQAAQGSTRKVGGTGLGLTVSRQLAQLLGGDVSLQSVVGEGSTFTVTIPNLEQITASHKGVT